MKIDDVRSIRWSDYSQNYLIDHGALSPILADPTFTFPEYSPDNQWHLFAHSAWGIHHFNSPDGIKWVERGVAIANAMRPYLYQENGTYFLLYEKYRPLALVLSSIKGRKWYSEIAISKSTDLRKWSSPVTLIRPALDWHIAGGNKSVSNPCLIKYEGKYNLYYSASLVLVPDCGFNEPDSIGMASASSIAGPYELLQQPIITVNKQDPWCNLSCGSIKALKCSDGYVGFENGIYWDDVKKQSGSAIIVLKSNDGLHWDRLIQDPIIRPTSGWRKSHVYACDVKYRELEKKWYLYYNARNGWKINEGQERIGLLTGSPS